MDKWSTKRGCKARKYVVKMDKIFEKRYDELSKSIAQFQKYMPNQKNLIFLAFSYHKNIIQIRFFTI